MKTPKVEREDIDAEDPWWREKGRLGRGRGGSGGLGREYRGGG